MTRFVTRTRSGRKTGHEEHDRLNGDVQAGRVERVVVYSVDRLGRDMIQGMERVASWTRAGVGIASVAEPIDIAGGPIGPAIVAMLLAFVEIGHAQRHTAQRAGIEAARAAGVYTGRLPGTTKPRPARAAELRGKGLTAEEIARALGVSCRTVWRYLEGRNPLTLAEAT